MLIYEKESYAINGAAMHVHSVLGHGFLESVYQEALEIEFQKRNIPYEREKDIRINYDGQTLKQNYRADFVCYGKIIVELKAIESLSRVQEAQVHNYLRATGFRLGLLYNWQ